MYLENANAPIIYIIVLLILSFLTFQSVYIFLLTKKRAKELGIEEKLLKKAMRSSAVTTIVPALAIVVGLITLAPVLGLPISWARLAMVGALQYELMSANIGAQAMGAEGLSAGLTPEAFTNAVWVMTTGVITLPLLTVLFYKKVRKTITSSSGKNNAWLGILVSAIMVSVFANYAIGPVVSLTKGFNNSFLAVAASSISMYIFMAVINKTKANWLKEYTLSFSMIIALVVVIFFGV